MNLQIRAEFVNIFNHTYLGNPSVSVAPQNGLTHNAAGQLTGGFGVVNEVVAVNGTPTVAANGNFNTQLAANPRSGTIIARFTF